MMNINVAKSGRKGGSESALSYLFSSVVYSRDLFTGIFTPGDARATSLRFECMRQITSFLSAQVELLRTNSLCRCSVRKRK